MTVMRLTEARIRALPFGSGIYRDETVKGMMVICHKTAKAYAVQGDEYLRGVRTALAGDDGRESVLSCVSDPRLNGFVRSLPIAREVPTLT